MDRGGADGAGVSWAEKVERRATWLAIAACLSIVVVAWTPRLVPRPAAPLPDRPDVEVAIHGAVRAPGRYRLAWGARVGDLVELAGGLTPDAVAALIDPVAPLVDGALVQVPRRRTEPSERRISVNEATLRELEDLPGIGPTLARRIVAARPFPRLDDLERVRGIGPATLERLRDHVTP